MSEISEDLDEFYALIEGEWGRPEDSSTTRWAGLARGRIEAQLTALMDAFNDQAGELEQVKAERAAAFKWRAIPGSEWDATLAKLKEAEATIERLRAALPDLERAIFDVAGNLATKPTYAEEVAAAFEPFRIPLTGKEQG